MEQSTGLGFSFAHVRGGGKGEEKQSSKESGKKSCRRRAATDGALLVPGTQGERDEEPKPCPLVQRSLHSLGMLREAP